MARILIFINHSLALYKFRRELPEQLINEGHEVYLCYPNHDKDDYFVNLGCKLIHFDMERKSTNLLKEINNISNFKKLCRDIKPDVLLTYTLKCCLYGSYIKGVKKIATVTGQSAFFKNTNGIKKIIYKNILQRFKKYDYVFFQNENDKKVFLPLFKDKEDKIVLVPGSGVNPMEHPYQGDINNDVFTFSFIGRIIKQKGICEYLDAIKLITQKEVNFLIAGPMEDELIQKQINDLHDDRVHYLGDVEKINDLYKNSSCVIVPSYSEGMSNALLEAQACGRPTIATNISGCKETMIPNVSGFLVEPRDSYSLATAMKMMLAKSNAELSEMGKKGKEHVLKNFSRSLVISEYIKCINKLLNN